jgi:hypothetical protein
MRLEYNFLRMAFIWMLSIKIKTNFMIKTSSKIASQIINNVDLELLMILKEDVQNQRAKIKNKLINLATINFDKALYLLIKEDIKFVKAKLSNKQNLAIAI